MKAFSFLALFLISRPALTAETPLEFEAALRQILSRSTTIRIQEAKLRGTRASGVPARLFYLPTVSASVTTMKANPTGSVNERSFEGVAEMNLFRFGADWAGMAAANADDEREEARLNEARMEAELEGIQALLSYAERESQVEIRRMLLSTEEKSYAIARERYSRGLLAIQEVQKVQIDLENARSLLDAALVQQAEAIADLERLLGEAKVDTTWPWKKKFLTTGPSLVQNAPESPELAERPDLRAALKDAEAEEERLAQSRRLIFPTLSGNFRYGYYQALAGIDGQSAWSGSLSLSIPLFDHLTLISHARTQAETLGAAEISLEKTRRKARSDWQVSRTGFGISLNNALSREKTLEISRKLYGESLIRFRGGRMTVNELATDLNRLLDSELLTVQAWSAAHLSWTKLCHARGLLVLDSCRP